MLGWPLGYPRILRARATLRHWGTVRNKMSLIVSVRLKIYVSHVYYRIYIHIYYIFIYIYNAFAYLIMIEVAEQE